jgi:chemotaxis protein methyltransferase CheR
MPLSFDEFIDKATEILNINLNGYKIKRVQRRTESLMRRYNLSTYDDCLKLLTTDPDFKEAYINHFTINTSEFFRNPENFKYLRKEIIPLLFQTRNKVNFWSAPCSNGSEPFTLAIILTELGYREDQYHILASDLDSNILSIARKGIFGDNSLQNIPPELLKKYFVKVSHEPVTYQLSHNIINQVTFEKKDLIKEPFTSNWDMILCRNFFIYLTAEIKDILTHKFTKALKTDGYFFLGNTEFIFTPETYGLKKVYSSFYRKTK